MFGRGFRHGHETSPGDIEFQVLPYGRFSSVEDKTLALIKSKIYHAGLFKPREIKVSVWGRGKDPKFIIHVPDTISIKDLKEQVRDMESFGPDVEFFLWLRLGEDNYKVLTENRVELRHYIEISKYATDLNDLNIEIRLKSSMKGLRSTELLSIGPGVPLFILSDVNIYHLCNYLRTFRGEMDRDIRTCILGGGLLGESEDDFLCCRKIGGVMAAINSNMNIKPEQKDELLREIITIMQGQDYRLKKVSDKPDSLDHGDAGAAPATVLHP